MALVAAVLSSAVRAALELRALVERAAGRTHRDDAGTVAPVVDAAFDLALRATAAAAGAAAELGRLARPVALIALRPPLMPSRFWPDTALARMVERGRAARANADRVNEQVAGQLLVAVVNEALDRIDLTQLVLDRVKLNDIIATVDIDDIATRLDIVAIVDRVPIDRVMARVDVNEIAAGVDVNAIAAKLDVGEFIARIDLTGIANQVLEEIDLPDIIRESSGAMASETVVGVRIRGIEADERINHVFDRILFRRRDRNTAAPQAPQEPRAAAPQGMQEPPAPQALQAPPDPEDRDG